MTTRRTVFAWCAALLGVLAFGNPSAEAGSPGEPLAVVVAKGSPLSELSLYSLKQLYMGDRLLGPSGKQLVPLNRSAASRERRGFDSSVLDMSPDSAAAYWIDRRIRGRSGAPKAVDPASVVQRVVSHVPGALSYVRLDEVSSAVKVITIDGKRPGDPGYPIRAERD